MAKCRAVVFLSAMFSFLLKEGLPFVLLPPSTSNASPNLSSWAGTRGVSPTSINSPVGRPARISARRLRRGRQTTMSMADVCHGDFPTPGWVRMAQRNLARVSVGDQLPDSTVRRLDDDGNMRSFSIRQLFGDRKGVLVGVPGAFTPTCSQVHLPEFVDRSAVLAAKGAEFLAFVAVNDVYVMRAWEEAQGAKGKVLMLSDGNGDLAASLGMMIDLTQQGMGLRCKRFVCIIEGGMVTHTRVGDEVGPVSAAAVEKVLDVSNSVGPRNAVLFDKMLDKNGEPRTPDTAESTAETPDLLPA